VAAGVAGLPEAGLKTLQLVVKHATRVIYARFFNMLFTYKILDAGKDKKNIKNIAKNKTELSDGFRDSCG
jgi:hypothetical protein